MLRGGERSGAARACEKSLSERLVESSDDGIFAFDGACRYTVWNPAMERIFGINASDVIGCHALDLYPSLKESGEHAFYCRALAGETILAEDRRYVVPKTGARVYYSSSYSPLRDGEGRIAGGLAIITETTRRQRRVRLQDVSAEVEAIGQMRVVAHEFNNLLTVIRGYSQLAVSQLQPVGPLYQSLREVAAASERAAELALGWFKIETLDVGSALRGIAPDLCAIAGADIELVMALSDDLDGVRADKAQLERMVTSLVTTAWDAIRGAGAAGVEPVGPGPAVREIVVGAENVALPPTLASRALGLGAGRYVCLYVSDTGGGMPPDIVAHLFEPAFCTTEADEGRRGAWRRVYAAALQLGGDIDVESDVSGGSTFGIYFPALPSEASEPERERSKVDPERPKVSVLVVDDDEAVCRFVTHALGLLGYDPVAASSGDRALELAATSRGPLDLAIVDIVMPGMSGPDFIERLRQVAPDTRILCMTGYAPEAGDRQGINIFGMSFIRKPFDVQELYTAVEDVLRGYRR